MIASGLKLYQCQNLLKINLLVINYKKKFFASIVIYNFKIAQ